MKKFNLPINDTRIQNLTLEQLDFMIFSEQYDLDKKNNQGGESYYDPDYNEDLDDIEENPTNIKSYLTEEEKEDDWYEV